MSTAAASAKDVTALLHGPVAARAWFFLGLAVQRNKYDSDAGVKIATALELIGLDAIFFGCDTLDGDTRLDADRRLPSTSPTPSTYEDVYEPNSRRPAGCPTVGNAAEAAAARAAHRAERRPRRAVVLETPRAVSGHDLS